MQKFFCIELEIPNVEEVSDNINYFFEKYADSIEEIVSVSQYTIGRVVENKFAIGQAAKEPQVQYIFKFLIAYQGKRIVNPSFE